MAHVTGLENLYTEREFERRKALRDVRKRGTPASVSCTMEKIAAKTNLPEISEEYRMENRRGKMLFLMAGVCLLALGIFLLGNTLRLKEEDILVYEFSVINNYAEHLLFGIPEDAPEFWRPTGC